MDVCSAVRLTVKTVPGGWDTLGVLCGKSGETLRHAFSGTDSRYVPSVIDAMTIGEHAVSIQSANCHAIADAVDATCGRSRPSAAPVANMDERIAKFIKETSDVVSAVVEAKADGHYSPNDKKRIRKEVIEALDALLQIERDAESQRPSGS
jgi:hypothetical protein